MTDRDAFTAALVIHPGEVDMFERYTDRAKRSVDLAHRAAQGLGHAEVGADHLLLGLLGEGGGVAFQALSSLGVTVEAANEAVCRHHPAEDPANTGVWLPYTPRFRKVAELAIRQSLELGCNYVGTEHLLLALIRDADNCEGAQALADCGIAEGDMGFLADVRAKVLELLRGYRDAKKRATTAADDAQPPGADRQDIASTGLEKRVAELESQVAYLMRYFPGHMHPPGAGASAPPYRLTPWDTGDQPPA